MEEVVESSAADEEDPSTVILLRRSAINAKKGRSCRVEIQCTTAGLAMPMESAKVVGRPYYWVMEAQVGANESDKAAM